MCVKRVAVEAQGSVQAYIYIYTYVYIYISKSCSSRSCLSSVSSITTAAELN